MSDLPSRRRPDPGVQLPPGETVIVFVTVCTKDRARWLADNTVHRLLLESWKRADAWLVGRYVIMPDHIHLFAAPYKTEFGIDAWIAFWKSRFTKSHQRPDCRWQRASWHTRLRNGQSYGTKWDYVVNNPVRHGLVQDARHWPFQGEIHSINQ